MKNKGEKNRQKKSAILSNVPFILFVYSNEEANKEKTNGMNGKLCKR